MEAQLFSEVMNMSFLTGYLLSRLTSIYACKTGRIEPSLGAYDTAFGSLALLRVNRKRLQRRSLSPRNHWLDGLGHVFRATGM